MCPVSFSIIHFLSQCHIQCHHQRKADGKHHDSDV